MVRARNGPVVSVIFVEGGPPLFVVVSAVTSSFELCRSGGERSNQAVPSVSLRKASLRCGFVCSIACGNGASSGPSVSCNGDAVSSRSPVMSPVSSPNRFGSDGRKNTKDSAVCAFDKLLETSVVSGSENVTSSSECEDALRIALVSSDSSGSGPKPVVKRGDSDGSGKNR